MRVLITGAGGYFAWELVRQLTENRNFEVIASTSNAEKIKADKNFKNVHIISNHELFDEKILSTIDVLIHTAFCRKSDGEKLTEALEFTRSVCEAANKCGVGLFVNISSQSVYGSKKENMPDENGKLNPDYLYALAKISSELLVSSICKKIKYTNIRMASLIGPSNFIPDNVVYKFVRDALNGKDILIRGGKQKFSFIDVRDAAEAIVKLILVPNDMIQGVYNLGTKKQVSIVELAECAKRYALRNNRKAISIIVEQEKIILNAGMNVGRICTDLNWAPKYSIEDTIFMIGEYIRKTEDKGMLL